MTLRKNITRKSLAVSFMALTLLVAVTLAYAPFASADETACPPSFGSVTSITEANVVVNGPCTSNGFVKGNVYLDSVDEWFDQGAGLLEGNIEATDCTATNGPGFAVKISNGALMKGNIIAKDCAPVQVRGTLASNVIVEGGNLEVTNGVVMGNLEVKEGDLAIVGAASMIVGNVKHTGPGDLTIAGMITGNVECDGTTSFTNNGAIIDPEKIKDCP